MQQSIALFCGISAGEKVEMKDEEKSKIKWVCAAYIPSPPP